jgi:DNA-binding Lrp family transcriptional regulator
MVGLLDGLPKISNLSYYAKIIKTKAAIRQGIALCELMSKKLAAPNGDGAEVLQEISGLSAQLSNPKAEVGQKRSMVFKTGADLAASTQQDVVWIVKGLVAKGAITELSAKVKRGKTTLILAMARAVIDGLSFLDQSTSMSPVVYLTEQPAASFGQAMKRANLLGRKEFVFLTYSDTRGVGWPQVAAAAVKECKRTGAGWLVVDTLGQFAGLTGDKENNSGDALEAMEPLQQATAEEIGVTLVRHERKSGGDLGDSGRGSSAFAGAVDIVLSLRKPEGNSPKNRRLLQSLSRFSETPNDLLIELVDRKYTVIGERRQAALKDAKDAIHRITSSVVSKAADLRELASAAGLSRPTTQRAIEQLVRDGMLSKIGNGKKGDPFRYFIPEIPFCSSSHIEEQNKANPEAPD